MGSRVDIALAGDTEPSGEIVGDGDDSAPEVENLFFGFRAKTLV
jgi:hypothetical protein